MRLNDDVLVTYVAAFLSAGCFACLFLEVWFEEEVISIDGSVPLVRVFCMFLFGVKVW